MNNGDAWIEEKGGEKKLIRFTPMISTEEETVDEVYFLEAIFGTSRCHLGSGTRTGASDRVKDFDLKGEAEISRADGERFGIRDGDTIRISSADGTIERRVRLVRRMNPGIIFVPKAFHRNDARDLLPFRDLDRPDSPRNKGVHVRIEKNIGRAL
jgi:predicted molibdopterin-dependent oxidoreductase YjgC